MGVRADVVVVAYPGCLDAALSAGGGGACAAGGADVFGGAARGIFVAVAAARAGLSAGSGGDSFADHRHPDGGVFQHGDDGAVRGADVALRRQRVRL